MSIHQFREAISEAGLTPPDVIEADGELHRFSSNGKRGDLAGWYVLHDDGIPAGIFGCWRAGLTETWCADIGRRLTDAECEQNSQRIESSKVKREQHELMRRAEARRQAASEWDAATPAPDSHPYLVRKGVPGLGLRVDADGQLLVPVRLGAELHSLQYIAADGTKRFLPGGRVAGCYFAFGKADGTVCVSEGFATAATIHVATAYPVVVAFNCGNLEAVARTLRERLPRARLIVCADDDAATDGNPGLSKATEAARAVGGWLAVPDFGPDRPERATDLNDLAQHRGADAVRKCIAQAKAPAGRAWPDPLPLPPELHPVHTFDMALLPDSLRPWIADVCERVQCPPDYVAVPVIVALGSLIGRKVRIRPKARDSWTVVPNVWGVVVGRPGAMKSPAVSEALQALTRLEAMAREEFEALQASYESEAELAKLRRESAREAAKKTLRKNGEISADALSVDEPDKPTLRRYRAHQSSMQALGELLRENPNGLMVERDELAGLLSNLAQEEKADERGFYLTGADGVQGFTFDTIGRGLNLRVPAVCISIIGTTQPGKLSRYLRQAQAGGEGDDGMMQRFGLLVWPDPAREWRNVDRWPDSDARREAFAVFDRLDSLTAESVGAEVEEDCAFLRFAPDALEAFTEWRTGLETRLRSGSLHPALESHFAKYRKTVPAIALIVHLADGNTGPVSLQATLRALAWADYLESHALRCYGATVAGEIHAARRILARIQNGELADGFKAREVDRAKWADLTDRDTVRAALALLVTHGYLVEVEVPSTAAGGRPTLAYQIHPASVQP